MTITEIDLSTIEDLDFEIPCGFSYYLKMPPYVCSEPAKFYIKFRCPNCGTRNSFACEGHFHVTSKKLGSYCKICNGWMNYIAAREI